MGNGYDNLISCTTTNKVKDKVTVNALDLSQTTLGTILLLHSFTCISILRLTKRYENEESYANYLLDIFKDNISKMSPSILSTRSIYIFLPSLAYQPGQQKKSCYRKIKKNHLLNVGIYHARICKVQSEYHV